MKVLLFGANGRLGRRIFERLEGHIVSAPRHEDMPVESENLPGYIADIKPDIIVNCSAFNGLEQCRDNPRQAVEVNCMAVGTMATVAELIGSKFIHFSTDYAEPAVDVYGATKFAGEKLALLYKNAAVFRLMSIYDPRDMQGSLSPVRHAMSGMNNKEVRCKVINQITAPTFTGWVADVVVKVINSEIELSDIGLMELAPYGRERKLYFGEAAAELFCPGKKVWVEEASELPIHRPDFSIFKLMRAQWLMSRLGMTLPSTKENLDQAFAAWQYENHADGSGSRASDGARSSVGSSG